MILQNSLNQLDSNIISKTLYNEKSFEEKKSKNEKNHPIALSHIHLKSQEDPVSMERESFSKDSEEDKFKTKIQKKSYSPKEKFSEITIPHLKLNPLEEPLSVERISVKKEKYFISEINSIEEQILNHKDQSKVIFLEKLFEFFTFFRFGKQWLELFGRKQFWKQHA